MSERDSQSSHQGENMAFFSVAIGKEQLRFTAAHFIAFRGFREPLHGHTYQVQVTVSGPVGPDGYVVDFLALKKIAEEEVARLHFRGHTNRDLRGLAWDTTEPLADSRIMLAEREVGSVRSILSLPTRHVALALKRREVETGQVVTAGGLPATVVSLPFPAI